MPEGSRATLSNGNDFNVNEDSDNKSTNTIIYPNSARPIYSNFVIENQRFDNGNWHQINQNNNNINQNTNNIDSNPGRSNTGTSGQSKTIQKGQGRNNCGLKKSTHINTYSAPLGDNSSFNDIKVITDPVQNVGKKVGRETVRVGKKVKKGFQSCIDKVRGKKKKVAPNNTVEVNNQNNNHTNICKSESISKPQEEHNLKEDMLPQKEKFDKAEEPVKINNDSFSKNKAEKKQEDNQKNTPKKLDKVKKDLKRKDPPAKNNLDEYSSGVASYQNKRYKAALEKHNANRNQSIQTKGPKKLFPNQNIPINEGPRDYDKRKSKAKLDDQNKTEVSSNNSQKVSNKKRTFDDIKHVEDLVTDEQEDISIDDVPAIEKVEKKQVNNGKNTITQNKMLLSEESEDSDSDSDQEQEPPRKKIKLSSNRSDKVLKTLNAVTTIGDIARGTAEVLSLFSSPNPTAEICENVMSQMKFNVDDYQKEFDDRFYKSSQKKPTVTTTTTTTTSDSNRKFSSAFDTSDYDAVQVNEDGLITDDDNPDPKKTFYCNGHYYRYPIFTDDNTTTISSNNFDNTHEENDAVQVDEDGLIIDDDNPDPKKTFYCNGHYYRYPIFTDNNEQSTTATSSTSTSRPTTTTTTSSTTRTDNPLWQAEQQRYEDIGIEGWQYTTRDPRTISIEINRINDQIIHFREQFQTTTLAVDAENLSITLKGFSELAEIFNQNGHSQEASFLICIAKGILGGGELFYNELKANPGEFFRDLVVCGGLNLAINFCSPVGGIVFASNIASVFTAGSEVYKYLSSLPKGKRLLVLHQNVCQKDKKIVYDVQKPFDLMIKLK